MLFRSLPLGLTATLKVDVTGQTPLTYQWKKNGVDIPNATTATLTLPNISASDESSYTVVITNALGTVESDIATVVIGASEGIASAKKTTTPLVIDGTLNEALWSLPYSISKVVVGAASNNTETYGVLWDDTYLYVGVKVLDATITTTNVDPYQNDAVELYFDMNHTGGVYDN